MTLQRTGIARSRRRTGPLADVIAAVLERDHYSCALCGGSCMGQRGMDWSAHHRRPRQMGGTLRPDANLPSNLIAVCGTGVDQCHGLIESRRAESYERGWLLHSGDVPSQTPIQHMLHGWIYLCDDGLISLAPPPIDRGGSVDLGGYGGA